MKIDFTKKQKEILTFSPPDVVRIKVENTGSGCWAFADQHSIVAPIGKQNNGTDAGKGKFS